MHGGEPQDHEFFPRNDTAGRFSHTFSGFPTDGGAAKKCKDQIVPLLSRSLRTVRLGVKQVCPSVD
jgi:hypothetical protein